MSQKKYYMDVINILSPINIFAGGLTIATQFITPRSEPNLANLLALASELFLASLASLVIVFLLLYGFWDSDIIGNGPKPVRCCGRDWGRHSLVVAQVVIVGIMMIAAFIVLGVAIIIVGDYWARGLGMGLVFLVFVGAILVGIVIGRNKFVRVTGALAGPPDPVPIHDVERDLTNGQTIAMSCFLLLEVIIMLALLGISTWQAIDPPGAVCNFGSVPMQWPQYTLAVSEVNPQRSILAVLIDMDTILSITFTEIDTIITRSWSHTIEIPTSITTTTDLVEMEFPTTISVSIISTVLIETNALLSLASSVTASLLLSPDPSEILTCWSCQARAASETFITFTDTTTVPCPTSGLVD